METIMKKYMGHITKKPFKKKHMKKKATMTKPITKKKVSTTKPMTATTTKPIIKKKAMTKMPMNKKKVTTTKPMKATTTKPMNKKKAMMKKPMNRKIGMAMKPTKIKIKNKNGMAMKPTRIKKQSGTAMRPKPMKKILTNMGNAFSLLVQKAAGGATSANTGTIVTQIRVNHSRHQAKKGNGTASLADANRHRKPLIRICLQQVDLKNYIHKIECCNMM